ncbi:MAG: rod shape-determining protein [Bacteroidales bacterium]
MIFAAIDIGSNAARLLFANVFEIGDEVFVEKATLVRIPTRLGEDVYAGGIISTEKAERLITTLEGFKYLIKAYNPVGWEACATAALREASNGEAVLKQIKEKTGIEVRLIDGIEEAGIIRQTRKPGFVHQGRLSVYIDVGGGSTDISVMDNNKILGVRSFRIGTLRILKDSVEPHEWDEMTTWLRSFNKVFEKTRPTLIGSGGNINKINKLYGNPATFELSRKKLKEAYDYLSGMSLEKRIRRVGLRPDRADVIVPAAAIFLKIMKTLDAKTILVPKIGLADGLVYQLYMQHQGKGETGKL